MVASDNWHGRSDILVHSVNICSQGSVMNALQLVFNSCKLFNRHINDSFKSHYLFSLFGSSQLEIYVPIQLQANYKSFVKYSLSKFSRHYSLEVVLIYSVL